jgi:hypothetical protein
MQHIIENPAGEGGALKSVQLGSTNRSEITPSTLSTQCRKQLYMSLFHGGVIDAATLSWAFAQNPDWRQA